MGGTATYKLACAFPKLFTRIAPLSGSIANTPENISKLSNMPIWFFVGSADKVVPPDTSMAFIAELSKINPNARNTVIEGADHFAVPTSVYLSEEYNLIDWLME